MPQLFGKANRAQPTSVADGAQVQIRTTGYGEVVTTQLGDNHNSLADEGSYYKVTNGTPGVSTTNFAAPGASFSNTAPQFILHNNNAAGGKRIYIDYVRIYLAASSAGAGVGCAVTIDPGQNRRSSGGTQFTAVNVNSDVATAAGGLFYWASGTALAATAGAAPRLVSRHQFKTQATPVGTAGDVFSMDFGEHMSGSATLAGALVPQVYPASVGPVVIGGGTSMCFYLWGFTAAPLLEWEIAWWER